MNEELKFLGKFTKKKFGVGGGGGGGAVAKGVRWAGRVGGGGVRVDVNAMLGVEGDVGYGGCEPRIEGIVQCTKRYCTMYKKVLYNFKKMKKCGGGGGGAIFEPKTLYVFKKRKRKKNKKK